MSTNPSNAVVKASPTASDEVKLDSGYRLPDVKTLQNAAKMAVVEDRPILMDYWSDSLEKKVIIGVREDGKKMLIKSNEEYTSYVTKAFRTAGKDYIIVTENSIYIVDAGIESKKVSFDT